MLEGVDYDSEAQAFLKQYVRYGRFLGQAFYNAFEEFTDLSKSAFTHLSVYTGSMQELNELGEQ